MGIGGDWNTGGGGPGIGVAIANPMRAKQTISIRGLQKEAIVVVLYFPMAWERWSLLVLNLWVSIIRGCLRLNG